MKAYEEATHSKSEKEQSFAVEDAEIQILEICKRTVLYRLPKSRFVREVRASISECCDAVENKELKARIKLSLESYAAKTLEREARLVKEKAMFFTAVALALTGGFEYPLAKRLNDTVIKREYTPEFTESPAFVKYSDEAKKYFSTYDNRLPLGIYHRRYMDMVRDTLTELAAADAKEDYSTNVSLRNVAEMTVRYDEQLKKIAKLTEAGEDLVYIKAHANCSKRCEKYQVGGSYHPSGLYSLSGRRGVTPEGVRFIPLSEATDNPTDRYVTKAGKVYQNGCITGFNCRHDLEPYRPGVKPEAVPTEAIEHRRKVEERQRAYEREIRRCKRLAIQLEGIEPEKAREAYRRAKRINKQYIRFSLDNDAAYYPDRVKLLDKERG